MRVLVTGGAGFIGSHLVEKLVERGDEVTVLDDLSAGKLENLESVKYAIRLMIGSLCPHIRDWAKDTDVIFHLATQCLVKGNEDPILIHEVNDVGTYNICLAAKEHNTKIVYISSSEAYGVQDKFPIKEDASMNPMSLYGLTKLIGEQYVQFFHKTYNMPVVIIRPFNTFGPRQREDAYAGVITSFIKRMISNQSPIIFGDGQQTRDFSYVSDIVDGMLLLSKLENGEIVNLGSGKETSILHLVDLIGNILDGKGIYSRSNRFPQFEEPRINDLPKLCADITLARNYGYEPKVTLEEGLKSYAKWYKSSRNRQ